MTIEIAIVLGLLLAAVILFATEKLPVDLVALLVMATLLLTGLITPEQGISGFSNTATVTVGAMFILSAGLYRTGAVNILGGALAAVGRRNFWSAVMTIMVAVALMSAFINNTPAVAVFIPIVIGLAKDLKVSPSKLLMPLSFASMFGGVCTLIGTSTNILVSSIATQHGQPEFGMFEFSSLGLVFFLFGTLYMVLVGIKLIPDRRAEGDLTQIFGLGAYLTDIVLQPEAKSVGSTIKDSPLVQDLDIDIIEIYRNGNRIHMLTPDTILQANDVLRVRSNVERIQELGEREGIVLRSGMKWRDEDLEAGEAVLVEAVIAPNSPLEGRTLKSVNFRNTYGATVLAIRHRGQLMRESLATTPLKAGDALLIEVRRDHLAVLKQNQSFVFVSEVGLPEYRKKKMIPAILIIAGVVITATLGILPIVIGAIIGCVLMVLTGCVTLEEAYRAIEWRVIFLLAGILTLGVALETTGAALFVSNLIVNTIGGLGPVALVSAFYLLTSLLTEAMSNNATAVLLAPIAIATADSIGVDARPFLMAVTFAASASFMTPVGYQTNTLIYGPGQYRFADFLKVGTPLNLMFWILATILIPVFWPFN